MTFGEKLVIAMVVAIDGAMAMPRKLTNDEAPVVAIGVAVAFAPSSRKDINDVTALTVVKVVP